jgi:hypothetical protein
MYGNKLCYMFCNEQASCAFSADPAENYESSFGSLWQLKLSQVGQALGQD